jgi:hypothetical protein
MSVIDPAERIAQLLHARPTREGRWIARCPAHNDRSPSLSISTGRDGRALVNCHAGCALSQVLKSCGLGLRDLFPNGPRPSAAQIQQAQQNRAIRERAVRDRAMAERAVAERVRRYTALRDELGAPEELGSELPPVPLLDSKLLPESLRPMVEDVADRMQVLPDFPAVVAVATLAGLCGRRAVIQPKEHDYSWVVVPNLWGGIVAPPGMMKSPVIACITAPAHAIEAQWRTEYQSELSDAQASKVLAELKARAWQQQYIAAYKKKDAEIPIQPDDSIPEPRQKRLITSDATFESLQWIMSNNPAGIFVLRDELTGWLAGLERQGREQERHFLLESWNGDSPYTADRVGRGSIHAAHCCASVFGGVQPTGLGRYLTDTLRDGPVSDGLVQRFQLLIWPDAKPDWCYRDRLPASNAIRTAEDVYRRIATMDADNSLRLKFAPNAQALFVAWLPIPSPCGGSSVGQRHCVQAQVEETRARLPLHYLPPVHQLRRRDFLPLLLPGERGRLREGHRLR